MKKKDITALVLIAVVTAIFSLVLSKSLLPGPSKHTLKVEQVNKIDGTFPDAKGSDYTTFFNSNALNPTQEITIGGEQNDKPLNSGNR